jgi:hypothetical protein
MKDELRNSKIEHGGIFLCERKISQMNYSYIVTIPKEFVKSTRFDRIISVRIILIDGCLKLVPSRAKNGDEEVELWRS